MENGMKLKQLRDVYEAERRVLKSNNMFYFSTEGLLNEQEITLRVS